MASETYREKGSVALKETAKKQELISKLEDYGIEAHIEGNIVIYDTDYTFPSISEDIVGFVEELGGGTIECQYHDTEHDEYGEWSDHTQEV